MKKIYLAIIATVLPLVGFAQGWPSQYGGVMLQGFYWDSYVDSQWSYLEKQADELSIFDLIWVPQSGYCNSSWNQMGYTPVYYFNHNSSFGTESELRSMINTFKAKGTGIIEDVVLNHHNNMGVNGSWVDFPAETYKGVTYQFQSTDVTANDDGGETKTWATTNGVSLSSNNDTGEDWSGCRDIDHYSSNVQTINNAYIDFLLNDLGYAGCRYDMVKGYSASFTGAYNSKNNVQFSVGEYWDGNATTVINWLVGTKVNDQIQSAAFDFPFRYTVRDAINNGSWTALSNTSLMSNAAYKRYAVTFVENHDTEYRSSSYPQDPIKKDTLAANAYLLAMPGTPCVFMKHWLDYKSEIKNMIECRKIAGIHNESAYSKYRTSATYYAVQVTGTNGKLMAVVGNTASVTPSAASWVKAIEGYHYAYYLSTTCETPWVNVASGTYENAFDATLTAVSATSDAQIVYTLDGSEPTAASTKAASGTKLNIASSCTLKVGLLVNGAVTKVITRNYVIQPFEAHTATVYLKEPSDWSAVYFYMWDKNNTELNGSWPGTAITATKTINGAKFYYKTVDVNSSDYYFNVIFDQGTSSNQSVDIGPIKEDVYYEISGMNGSKYTVTDITDQYKGGSEGGTKGDVNGDGVVNTSDVTALINIILGTAESVPAADVNGDGTVNTSDVTALIGLILG